MTQAADTSYFQTVGRRFKANEIFVPEVLVAARAMKTSMKPPPSSPAPSPSPCICAGRKSSSTCSMKRKACPPSWISAPTSPFSSPGPISTPVLMSLRWWIP
ncbi:MAG: B12-binding domain-containing protein [Kiritimatiellae bacterium]|nr:B12-binding domain-containing protein [Kiritimatiellia bacterium]